MTAKTSRKTGGRSRRTKGAGSIIHRADGRWEFRREISRDPATGKRRFIAATGRTKADARERFDAKVAEMERTGLLPGAKSPYLKDYAERWLEEYRLNVKPTTYRTRAGRIHACMEVIGCIRLTELTPDHIRQCMRVLSKRLAPSTLKDHFVSLKMMLDQAELEELIPVDPCRRVKPPRVEPTETRILSPDQPKQLIEAVPNRGAKRRGPALTVDVDESWMLLFELAFAAGMREGERYALMPYELEQRDGVPGINVQQQSSNTAGRRSRDTRLAQSRAPVRHPVAHHAQNPRRPPVRAHIHEPVAAIVGARQTTRHRPTRPHIHQLARQPDTQQHRTLQLEQGPESRGPPTGHHPQRTPLDRQHDGPRQHARRRTHRHHGPHQHHDDQPLHPQRRSHPRQTPRPGHTDLHDDADIIEAEVIEETA